MSAPVFRQTAKKATMTGLQIAATIVPEPCVDTVLAVMKSIQDASRGVKVHKEKATALYDSITTLRELFKEHHKALKHTSLNSSVEEILQALEVIKADIDKWSAYSRFQATFKKTIIAGGLDDHQSKLKYLIQLFTFSATTYTVALTQEQNELLRKLVEDGLSSTNSEELLETLHKALEDMQKLSLRDDHELVGPDGKPISRITFDREFTRLQSTLKYIGNQPGRRTPMRLSKGALKIDDSTECISGNGGCEVIFGWYLGSTKVAIKKLKTLNCDENWRLQFHNELKTWGSIDPHDHLLPFIGYTCEVGDVFGLVSPWMKNGTIIEYCTLHKHDADRLHLLAGAADGLKYLHNNIALDEQCVHGNLKGSNILVNDKLEAVIFDFRMAKVVTKMQEANNHQDTYTRQTAPRWSAPESITSKRFTAASDVWSFGMVMLEVFTLQQPFPEQRKDLCIPKVVTEGNRPTPPTDSDWVTEEVGKLMQECWMMEPKERPQMVDVHRRLLEAEQFRKENPPVERKDPHRYDPHAHLKVGAGFRGR